MGARITVSVGHHDMECRVCGVVRTTNGSNALGVVNPEPRFDFPADELRYGGG